MTPSSPQPAPGSGQLVMGLSHGAKSAQIGTGDVLIQRVMRGGVESQFPAAMQYVATVPALVSFDDGQGNSATISYPVPASGPGTRGNGFPVKASANGDVMVTLTFWRPQRRPIPPEKGEWTDIGGLNYSAGAEAAEANVCPQSAFSTTDPTVRPLTPADVFPASYFGLRDLAPDRPASPASTFTFTLNLTSCLSGLSFDAGETQTFTFNAGTPNGTGGAQQQLSFKRQ